MKVTMSQLIAFRNSGGFFGKTTLPLKSAYKLNKIRRAAEQESEFYSEKFQDILKKYAKTDENGNFIFGDGGEQILIQEDKIEECNKAVEDLQNLEVEIETYGLKIDDFGEDLSCTPDELEAIMPFIE